MKKYSYEEMLDDCKDFSKSRLNRNLIFVKSVLFVLNPIGLWIIDVLLWIAIWSIFIFLGLFSLSLMTVFGFVIAHLMYWKFVGSKNMNEFIEDINIEQVRLSLKALKETKQNKFRKNG